MFLHRLAAGLVFAAGAGISRLAVTGESFLLLGLGFGAAVVGLSWFAAGGPSSTRRSVARDIPSIQLAR
jgi:hypothetical protein